MRATAAILRHQEVRVKPSFTERELDVMAILWERGPSTVAEVRERLDDDLAHNTVQTVLRILEDKGYVGHTDEGRAHRFHARVKREIAGATAASRWSTSCSAVRLNGY